MLALSFSDSKLRRVLDIVGMPVSLPLTDDPDVLVHRSWSVRRPNVRRDPESACLCLPRSLTRSLLNMNCPFSREVEIVSAVFVHLSFDH